MSFPLRYIGRSLWTRRVTSLSSVGGIALVVFVLSASLMLATGFSETMKRSGTPRHVLVLQTDAFAEGGSRIPQAALGLAASAPFVRRTALEGGGTSPLVSGETVTNVYLGRPNDESQFTSVQVRGVTESAYALRPFVRVLEGRLPKAATSEAMVGRGLAGKFRGLKLQDGFELQKGRRLEIVGVFEAQGTAFESEVWANLDVVRAAFGTHNYLSSITLELADDSGFSALQATLSQDRRLGLSAERETDYYVKVSNNLSAVITGVGSVVSVITGLGATLAAAILQYGAVSHRRREWGILRAIGFPARTVLSAVLLESVTIALTGGALGVLLALSMAFVRISTINWTTGQELAFGFSPSFGVLAIALLTGVSIGVFGGLFPAVKASRLEPARALRQ